KVRVKPGQPIWFGILERPAAGAESARGRGGPDRCYVFGLPGNPVSSMVCCELFARTAIRRLMAIEPPVQAPMRAVLAMDHFNSGNRPTYHPARWSSTQTGPVVELVRWVGSADLCATVGANAMALFPEGDRKYTAGTVVDVYPW